MDRKITKERVNIHLEYDWIKYVVIIAVAILMWWMIYSSANSIPNQFKIDLMCVDSPMVSETMTGRLNEDRTDMFGLETPIKSIGFTNQYSGTAGNTDFSQIYPLRAMTEDMLIAPQDWMRDNPTLLAYLLDFKTIYEPYAAKDKNGKPIKDENGNEIVYDGYWADDAGKAMLKRLQDWGALYTYHFDRAYWEDFYREKWKNSYPKEEDKPKLEAAVKETVDELEQAIERNDLEGKVLGIILNKIPGLENGCFFTYADEPKDEDDKKEPAKKREYVLSIFRPNLDASSGGGNKGHFNGAKMDKARTETLDFIEFMFTEDVNAADKLNVVRYAAL